jgi:hypothetical protein
LQFVGKRQQVVNPGNSLAAAMQFGFQKFLCELLRVKANAPKYFLSFDE